MRTIFIISLLGLCSSPVWATDSSIQEHSYGYSFENVNIGTNPNSGSIVTVSSSSLNMNNVNVAISGWADSAKLNSDDTYNYDRVISAEVQPVYNYGWAVRNSEEATGTHQTIGNNSGFPDFDFVLLSFSEEVKLDTLNFGWAGFDHGSQEVSVAAIGDSGFNKLTSQNSTWSSIIAGAVSNSFSIDRLSEHSYQGTSSLNIAAYAKYWLVGAYNTVFGSVSHGTNFNDAFKISGLEFSNTTTENPPPTEVSEPGALALMSLGLGLVLYRRKRRA